MDGAANSVNTTKTLTGAGSTIRSVFDGATRCGYFRDLQSSMEANGRRHSDRRCRRWSSSGSH